MSVGYFGRVGAGGALFWVGGGKRWCMGHCLGMNGGEWGWWGIILGGWWWVGVSGDGCTA